jgi:hypothetical protein
MALSERPDSVTRFAWYAPRTTDPGPD